MSGEQIAALELEHRLASAESLTTQQAERIRELEACIKGMESERKEYHRRYAQYDISLTASEYKVQSLEAANKVLSEALEVADRALQHANCNMALIQQQKPIFEIVIAASKTARSALAQYGRTK